MKHLVVTGKQGDNVTYSVLDETYNIIENGSTNIGLLSRVCRNRLGTLNFSISDNGSVVEDCGKFTRFTSSEGAVGIVLAEVVNKRDDILGYKVLINGAVMNMRKESIFSLADERKDHVFQNAIVRGNMVNCYPNHPFEKVQITTGNERKGRRKPIPSEGRLSDRVSEHPVVKTQEKATLANNPNRELLNKLEASGIDISGLTNPNLSEEQVRILGVAKKNGACVEYFAKPELDESMLKFYADRVKTPEVAKDIKILLDHPELEEDTVSELYQCIYAGMDVEDMLNKSPEHIYLERMKASKAFWSDVEEELWFKKLMGKAMNSANKLKADNK